MTKKSAICPPLGQGHGGGAGGERGQGSQGEGGGRGVWQDQVLKGGGAHPHFDIRGGGHARYWIGLDEIWPVLVYRFTAVYWVSTCLVPPGLWKQS